MLKAGQMAEDLTYKIRLKLVQRLIEVLENSVQICQFFLKQRDLWGKYFGHKYKSLLISLQILFEIFLASVKYLWGSLEIRAGKNVNCISVVRYNCSTASSQRLITQ